MSTLAFESELLHEENFEPRYDLSDEEIGQATREFFDRPDLPEGRFVCTNFSGSDPQLSNVARTVERTVFESSFSNDDDEMKSEYGHYEDASHFIMVMDRKTERPAGVIRLLKNSEYGLKTLNDVSDRFGTPIEDIQAAHDIDDLDDVWDVGTLAVMPEYRGSGRKQLDGYTVSTMLYRATFLLGAREDIGHLVTVIDHRARRNVDRLGIPFKEMYGTEEHSPFEYLGSPKSYALHGKFAEFEPTVMRQADFLREQAKIKLADVLRLDVKSVVRRKLTAKIVGRLATGDQLDSQMHLTANV